MKCPDCGSKNPADAKFCGDCGRKIESAGKGGGSGGASWENVFKWIGIVVVGLFVLGLLAGM
ncbi:MAG: zinc-ribbon domain-containing protein [Kiloniellaceae bacterium]